MNSSRGFLFCNLMSSVSVFRIIVVRKGRRGM